MLNARTHMLPLSCWLVFTVCPRSSAIHPDKSLWEKCASLQFSPPADYVFGFVVLVLLLINVFMRATSEHQGEAGAQTRWGKRNRKNKKQGRQETENINSDTLQELVYVTKYFYSIYKKDILIIRFTQLHFTDSSRWFHSEKSLQEIHICVVQLCFSFPNYCLTTSQMYL